MCGGGGGGLRARLHPFKHTVNVVVGVSVADVDGPLDTLKFNVLLWDEVSSSLGE